MNTIKPIPEVDSLITLIYKGLLEDRPWQTFLHSLRLRMNCDVVAMSLRPAKPGVRPLTIWDRSHALSNTEAQKAIEDHEKLADSDPLGNALSGAGDIYTLDDVIDRAELVKTEFYQKLMKPYGIAYQMGMCFSEPSGGKCYIGLMNGPDKHSFGDAEKQFFLSFRSHLEHALQLYAVQQNTASEKEIYEDTLDRLSIGTIILNKNKKIVHLNNIARHLLSKAPSISVVHNKIVVQNQTFNTQLNQVLDEALEWRKHDTTNAYAKVLKLDHSDEHRFDLLVRVARPEQWYQNEGGPALIIYLNSAEEQISAPEQFIAQLFGLTLSEAHLAILIANGFSLVQAAHQLKLTESSVRTYSKKIFAKTGVTRQAELVRLILKSVALLA